MTNPSTTIAPPAPAAFTLVAQGPGRFPIALLARLRAWPRTETDALAIGRSQGMLDPRVTTQVLLQTDQRPPAAMLVGPTDNARQWVVWHAKPHDIPPEAP